MSKNTIKTLTTTAVIGLASAGVPALAHEANSELATVTSVNEPAIVEKPTTKTVEKSSDVKPALDDQKQVVEKTKEQLTDAQDKANDANKQVSSAQSDVTEATETVKHAEEVASKATPQNIEANKADQKANLADQKANETETANTDAKIATQTETVTKAQTGVSNAEQELKDANADVSAKETQVKSAKDAISGTGLAQAEDKLDEAKAETKGAEQNVTLANTALTDAKKADQKRQKAIDNAQADVDAKTTLVNETKENLESATTTANGATTTLSQASDKLDKATKALDNVDIVKIADLTQFKQDKAEGDSDFMTDSGATVIENSSTKISEADKNKIVDFNNITEEQKQEIALYNLKVVNAIRKNLGLSELELNTGSMKAAQNQMDKYIARNKNILTNGHLPGDYFGENGGPIALAKYGTSLSMYKVKEEIYNIVMSQAFADAPSKWGHSENIQKPISNFGASFGIISGELYSINVYGIYTGKTIKDENDVASLEKAYEDAKAEKDTAQTASEKANNALKQASTDYANALDLKTSAEKTLADATATPIQTTIAENNLRLAKLALDSSEKRQAEAQKAVDNFSADLASKKQALDNAKSALESAKRVQEQKVQALADVKTELTKQESKLEALKAKKAKLIEEKDSLVKEAKALEEKLKAYVEAPINLAKAQTTLAEKQDALKNAEAKAKSAKNLVDAIATTLEAEQVKLNKIQDKFDKLQDLDEKAKDNVIATLPDGTIVAIPNGTPTAEELPEFDINSLNKGPNVNKILAIDDKGNVTVNGQAYTSQQQVSSKPIYSRVERAKTLPDTGESSSVAMLVLGAILGAFGLVTVRRKN